ncbi:uncharacterized protein DS421_13g422480 [Arachis hypogaea]|nr:uncharacterized protein DS421_13g422480 [Arachis hypogaea]
MARDKVIEVKDELYVWVHVDAKCCASLYYSIEKISELNAGNWVRDGVSVGVELLPIVAFLRAYECLMEFLETPPSLNIFFSLFQTKEVHRDLWVNLRKLLSISNMLKVENDKEALREYIVPSLSSTRMRSFLDQKKKNDKQVSFAGKDVGMDTTQSSARPVKRKKPDSEKSLEVLFVANLEFREGNEFGKQMRLHGFLRGMNAHSVWSERFSFPELDDKVAQYLVDVNLLKEVGKRWWGNTCRFLVLGFSVWVGLRSYSELKRGKRRVGYWK